MDIEGHTYKTKAGWFIAIHDNDGRGHDGDYIETLGPYETQEEALDVMDEWEPT